MTPTDQEIEALFKLYDRDHNDRIDMKEGIMGLMQHQEFFYYDMNLDGKLDENELMYMYDTRDQNMQYSGSADFVEVYQRLQSHNKLPSGWEASLGRAITA
ncbi:EF-hand domain-containing protein [bacterium LRH843]|nr:EF-hand domain-containing protein [bacterium LRH843]